MTQNLLVEQHEALNHFLDELLCEEPATGKDDIPDKGEASPAEAERLSPQPVMERRVEEAPLEEVDDNRDPAKANAPKTDFQLAERIPVIPDWGLRPFQAMVFKVGELSLAIPLVELSGVLEWPAVLEAGDKRHEWLLGSCQHDGQTVMVIQTARLVFPQADYQSLYEAGVGPHNTRIILINNGKTGLACDLVHEIFTIQPQRVKWRSTRARRQWLAGTMLDELLVILDARTTTKIVTEMLGMSE